MTQRHLSNTTALPVFYREDMLANIDSYSPSAGERGRVLKAWLDSSLSPRTARIPSHPPLYS
jgi:hypothetical protein